LHGGFQRFGRDVEFLGPVPDFVVLIDADAATVLGTAAFGSSAMEALPLRYRLPMPPAWPGSGPKFSTRSNHLPRRESSRASVAYRSSPMAPRPYWKGYLKLSLVSCPIALFPVASSTERVSFRQINKLTGNRLRQQLVDEVTREPVESQDKGKGYEIAKDTYVQIEDEELEAIEIESSHTVEIDSFVPRVQIDERYIDNPYYIAPNDTVGQDAYAVIRDAMKGKEMVALGRVVLNKRERVMMLMPWGKGILGTSLRYPYEVRDEGAYFDDIEEVNTPPDMLKLAEHILDSKAANFEPSKFVDRYETALVEMLKSKSAGEAPKSRPSAKAPSNVVNLMDALRKSIDAEKAPTKQSAAKKVTAAKQEQMRKQPQFKLPIKGGREVEAEAVPTSKAKTAVTKSAKGAAKRKSA